MERKTFRAVALGATALVAGMAMWSLAASADDVTLTIESWRNDDLPIWQDKIIPAFEKANPGIKVVFSPTAPTELPALQYARPLGLHFRRISPDCSCTQLRDVGTGGHRTTTGLDRPRWPFFRWRNCRAPLNTFPPRSRPLDRSRQRP